MDRRKAIATAGAVTATAAAAVIALGANLGIFGLTQRDPNVGKFPATAATSATGTTPATTAPRYVDLYDLPAAGTNATGSGAAGGPHQGDSGRESSRPEREGPDD